MSCFWRYCRHSTRTASPRPADSSPRASASPDQRELHRPGDHALSSAANNVSLFDRILPYFIALPPSVVTSDLSSLLLAGNGYTCKYHHSLAQAALLAF